MITLRPYQQSMIDEARAAYARRQRAVLFQLPTGGGKTITASTVVHGAAQKGNVTWWLAHRRELVEQASQTFHALGIPHGTVQSGHVSNPQASVQVASIQTIVRRLDQLTPPSLIIFDEAHHIGAASWDAIFHRFPAARILGLTATPWRLDGQGLGRWFGHMVSGPSTTELIENGSLSRYRLFAPAMPDLTGVGMAQGDYQRGALAKAMDKPAIVGDAITHYIKLCPGKRAVVFAAGVENSRHIAAQFNAAGIPAEHVDGEMGAHERDAAVARFKAGQTLILCNADLFGEGFDVPAIEAAILLRPTKSLSLHLQQVGRALRPAPGKDVAIILDHAGNSLTHGLPDDEREWSLDGAKKRAKNTDGNAAGIRTCPACYAIHRPAPFCPQCKHEYTTKERAEMEVLEGELVEVTREQRDLMKKRAFKTRKKEEWECTTVEELAELGRSRGYKFSDSWAAKLFETRGKKSA